MKRLFPPYSNLPSPPRSPSLSSCGMTFSFSSSSPASWQPTFHFVCKPGVGLVGLPQNENRSLASLPKNPPFPQVLRPLLIPSLFDSPNHLGGLAFSFSKNFSPWECACPVVGIFPGGFFFWGLSNLRIPGHFLDVDFLFGFGFPSE